VRAPTPSRREGAPRWGAQPLLGPGLPLAMPQHPACTAQPAAGHGEKYSLQ